MTWKNSQFRKKTTKAVKKRYGIGKGQGGFKFTQVAKDLAWVKSRLNVEKKQINSSVNAGSVGQTLVNGAGYYAVDLLPTFVQGDGEGERIGNSLKLTGMNQKWQFCGQSKCYTSRRVKMHYIKTTDRVNSLPTILADMYDVNPLTGNIDYFSERNYANSTKAHKIIRKFNYSVRTSSVADPSALVSPALAPMGTMNCSLKLNDVLRFASDADTSPQDYRIFVVVFIDTGNNSASTTSTNPGNMVPPDNSGLELQHHYRTWYVDN